MVDISIKPALRNEAGYLLAKGHALKGPHGQDLVCAAITTLIEGLAANLDACWDVKLTRKAEDGRVDLVWTKTDRAGKGLKRANDAAGFTLTALRALAKEYPDALQVRRMKPNPEYRETAKRERREWRKSHYETE